MTQESAYSFNFKLGTGYDAPMMTVRGGSAAEFQSNVQAIAGSAIGADLNAMIEAVNNTSGLNKVLGATGVDPVQNPEPVQQQAPPQQEQNPWNQGGQQPQGQWGQPQQAQAPQGNQWGQPPAQQGGWGGAPQQGGGAPQGDAPINPFTGQPMLYKEGISKKTGKPYKMWVDERPYPQIKDLPDSQKAAAQFIR